LDWKRKKTKYPKEGGDAWGVKAVKLLGRIHNVKHKGEDQRKGVAANISCEA